MLNRAMRSRTHQISPRPAAGLVLIVLGVALLSGCAANLERRPRSEAFAGNQAGSWELVFPSPTTIAYAGDADPRTLPEYSRADSRLNTRPNTPLLASNQWPEPDRPSLRYQRRIYIDPRPENLLFFETRSDYYGPRSGYYTGNTTYYNYDAAPAQGTWGFWR
jgi:hypothetical protein